MGKCEDDNDDMTVRTIRETLLDIVQTFALVELAKLLSFVAVLNRARMSARVAVEEVVPSDRE